MHTLSSFTPSVLSLRSPAVVTHSRARITLYLSQVLGAQMTQESKSMQVLFLPFILRSLDGSSRYTVPKPKPSRPTSFRDLVSSQVSMATCPRLIFPLALVRLRRHPQPPRRRLHLLLRAPSLFRQRRAVPQWHNNTSNAEGLVSLAHLLAQPLSSVRLLTRYVMYLCLLWECVLRISQYYSQCL